MNLEELTDETFRPFLNQVFAVTTAPETIIEMTLEQVNVSPHQGESRKQFSLLFLGPQVPVLRQGTYAMESANFSRTEIFICPLGVSAKGMEYEAVFA